MAEGQEVVYRTFQSNIAREKFDACLFYSAWIYSHTIYGEQFPS